MTHIFISYSREDRAIAQKYADVLEAQELPVWWDPNILPGQRFRLAIEEALRNASCAIVLWSSTSVNSDWVNDEASEAARRHILIPVLIEAVPIPLGFGQIQTLNLTDWNGKAEHAQFRRLLDAVSAMLGNQVLSADVSDTDSLIALLTQARMFSFKELYDNNLGDYGFIGLKIDNNKRNVVAIGTIHKSSPVSFNNVARLLQDQMALAVGTYLDLHHGMLVKIYVFEEESPEQAISIVRRWMANGVAGEDEEWILDIKNKILYRSVAPDNNVGVPYSREIERIKQVLRNSGFTIKNIEAK